MVQSVKFEPIKKDKKAYVRVMEQIQRMIQEGSLKPGDLLPPERILLEQFAVSRATMRQALSAMEVANIIEVRSGLGAFVCSPSAHKGAENGLDLENSADPWDIMEARMTIEPVMAALAAMKATPEDIKELRRILDDEAKFDKPENFNEFEELDNNFHFTVAKATHNEILHRLAQNLFEIRTNGLWKHIKFQTVGRMGLMRDIQLIHESIYEAIAERNPVAAERRSVAHYDRLRKLVFNE